MDDEIDIENTQVRGHDKPNHLWTSILILIVILLFLLFIRSCKGKK